MKKILVVLLLALMSCNSQNKAMFTESLKIKYTSGDESYKVQEMAFYIKGNKVMGRITVPDTDELLSSETELDQESINFLNSFLNLAKGYRTGCNEKYNSSYVEYYEITLDKENFKIFKFCDWKSFTYTNLEKQIFGNYLKKLVKKEKVFNDSISSKMIGRWKENERLENLVLESKWNLTKLDSVTTDSEYLEFLNNQKAVLNRKGKKIYYEYRIYLRDGSKYLEMIGDRNKNGEEFVYGQRFQIIELSNNQIKMTH